MKIISRIFDTESKSEIEIFLPDPDFIDIKKSFFQCIVLLKNKK